MTPISFLESTSLKYKNKGYSVFIQTDKAVYRPGNTVQFRAVVLSPKLKPSVTGGIDVVMTDGAGNLVRNWNREFTTKGVWAGSLDIADKPVLGNWNISVDVNGQVFTKTFLVAEYVLPKFQVSKSASSSLCDVHHYYLLISQVEVDVPTYATFKEKVTATIKVRTKTDC